jgi:hypothetical protein
MMTSRFVMQDAHLAFNDLVNGRKSSGHARFLKRLQSKTLLDDWPFEYSFLSQARTCGFCYWGIHRLQL